MSRERMTGRLLDVWTENPGTTLTADAAAGTTTLQVDDVSPFNGADSGDGPGGTLQVGDQVVAYVDIDDDASTITLAAPLATAVSMASENADVLRWNDLYNQLDTVQHAMVMPEGKRDQADAIEAVVSDNISQLANSDRGGPGEVCHLVRDGDEWQVAQVGRPAAAKGTKFYRDVFSVTTPGDQTLLLTYVPTDRSEHVYWRPQGLGGIYQPANLWTRDGQTIVFPDAGGRPFAVGDGLTVQYAYEDQALVTPQAVDPPPDPATGTIVYLTGGVTLIPTGNGSLGHGNAGPTMASDASTGFGTIGAYYSDQASYYGGGAANVAAAPSLPTTWQDNYRVYSMVRIPTMVPATESTPDVYNTPWQSVPGVEARPFVSVTRSGAYLSYSTDQAETFKWNDWVVTRIDGGRPEMIFTGLNAGLCRMTVVGSHQYPAGVSGFNRLARTWSVTQAAILVFTS